MTLPPQKTPTHIYWLAALVGVMTVLILLGLIALAVGLARVGQQLTL